jgi:uncharacterized protein YgiB involved in biofilm formation
MDLTECFETSAKLNLTPGKYPKENIQDSENGKNLKSRTVPSTTSGIDPATGVPRGGFGGLNPPPEIILKF